ncbi:MAG: Rho termination factor N-terminal domain-containing protein, partial [Flavobacteriales bacterium]
MYDILELNGKKVAELREIASKLEVKKVDKLKKQDLVYSILDEQALLNTNKKNINKPHDKTEHTKAPAKKSTEKDSDSKAPTKRVQRDSSEKRKPRESSNSKATERRSGDSLRDRRSKRQKDEDTNDSDKSS